MTHLADRAELHGLLIHLDRVELQKTGVSPSYPFVDHETMHDLRELEIVLADAAFHFRVIEDRAETEHYQNADGWVSIARTAKTLIGALGDLRKAMEEMAS